MERVAGPETRELFNGINPRVSHGPKSTVLMLQGVLKNVSHAVDKFLPIYLDMWKGKRMTKIEETAKAAAEWWSSRLVRVDEAQTKAFEEALNKRVKFELMTHGRVRLEHDYHALGILGEVSEATIKTRTPKPKDENIFMGHELFPQKHVTTITAGLIKPKEGYGNWTDDIVI